MAVNRVYKFRTIGEVQAFLNGAIVGGKPMQGQGPPSNHAPGIPGLVGLTLTFTSPSAATVTFAAGSGPDPNTLLPKDIKAQIETALTTVQVTYSMDGHIVITEKTPTSGVAIANTGTANAALGFDTSAATVGKVYKPAAAASPPVAPYWVWAYMGNDNMHNIFTFE